MKSKSLLVIMPEVDASSLPLAPSLSVGLVAAGLKDGVVGFIVVL